MPERRSQVRMLCADMVEVSWQDGTSRTRKATALLEDISGSGACLQFETAVPPGATVEIVCGGRQIEAVVRYCVYREIGYFVGVEFPPEQPWDRGSFEPEHLLDLEEFLACTAASTQKVRPN